MKIRTQLIILLFAIFGIFIRPLNAGIVFRHFDVRAGLDDNYVKSLNRDVYGRLWIVARGINIFDGYTITPVAIPTDFSPEKVVFDATGGVWAQGYSRLLFMHEFSFEDATKHLHRLNIPPHVTDLFSDKNGNLYFITPDSIYYHNYSTNTGKSTPAKDVTALTPSPYVTGQVYTLDTSGTVHEINITSDTRHPLAHGLQGVKHIMAFDNGQLWLYGGKKYGLRHLSLNTANPTITPMEICTPYLINTIVRLPDGRLAAGTNSDGILLLDIDGSVCEKICHDSSDVYSLSSNHVTSLLCEDEGIIAGTAKCGFDIADMKSPNINRCYIDIDEDICFFHEQADGTLLIGTDGKGLAIFPKAGMTTHTRIFDQSNSPLTSQAVIGLTDWQNGSLLIGTYGGGIYVLRDGNLTPLSRTNDPLNYVRHMAIMSDSSLWAGTFADGLFNICTNKGYTLQNSTLRTNCITGLGMKNDTMLVATSTGLYQICPGDDKISDINGNEYLNSAVIHVLNIDTRGLIWIGNADGLDIFDSTFGHLAHLDMTTGLSDNTVRALTEDLNGDIWLTGNNGISHVAVRKTENGYRFIATKYDNSDGLGDITFNRYAISCLNDGRILAGGLGKYVIITPNSTPRLHYREKVAISSLTVNGHRVNKGESVSENITPLTQSLPAARHISLAYNHNFIIEFSTFDLINAPKIRYEYRLDENKWFQLTDNCCRFNEMSPGQHKLQIRTVDSPEITEITLDIHPPLWRSNKAIAFYVVILVLIIVGIFLRIKRNHRREMHRRMMEKTFFRQENAPLTRDESFLVMAKETVEANISDETFGVERLSEALSMSRSNLYKKIQILTDKTPIEFIRLIRIREGKKLIDYHAETGVAQVAYRVGLSPKQFSKYFKEEYGILPSTYINNQSTQSQK